MDDNYYDATKKKRSFARDSLGLIANDNNELKRLVKRADLSMREFFIQCFRDRLLHRVNNLFNT